MGTVVIKIDNKKSRLISRLVKEMGGKVFPIDDEQFEDLALGEMMTEARTGETVDYDVVMKELRNGH